MACLRLVLLLIIVTFACTSCGSHQTAALPVSQAGAAPLAANVSADCTEPSGDLPSGASRVYIALRNGTDGTGRSADDARDGSTSDAFDTVLRCYAEGCSAPQAIPRTDNLIVCIGPGVFPTRGTYDAIVNDPHLSQLGFTVGKGWKIHGMGRSQTILQLSVFAPGFGSLSANGLPPGTAGNVVISTVNDNASGVEVSDLTVDANYSALKQIANTTGVSALNLEAIRLRSNQGGNWIHNVNVINVAGEIGQQFEIFAVWIISVATNSQPSDSTGNIIENVNMSQFGGGFGTGITVTNSLAEIRNNTVNGYQIGYGGFIMGAVHFHNNVASDTQYGFNIDSLANNGVTIESNQIMNPRSYGMVIGGGGTYSNMKIAGNTIQLGSAGSTGILFQGNVTNTTVSGNSITAGPSPAGLIALRNFSNGPLAGPNGNNIYQSNQIDSGLSIVFEPPSLRSLNCAFGNHDQHGVPRGDLPDTTSVPCTP